MVERDGQQCTFRIRCPGVCWVALAGEFNNWSTQSHHMHRTDDEQWEITLDLRPGTYRFRYVASDGQWMTDYAAFGVVPNGLNGWDSLVHVPLHVGSVWDEPLPDGPICLELSYEARERETT